MKTIFKFELEIEDLQEVAMPLNAELLTAQVQNGRVVVWAVVDTDEVERVTRTFRICGTGHHLPVDPGHYLGTVQLLGGSLVFHVFAEPLPEIASSDQ